MTATLVQLPVITVETCMCCRSVDVMIAVHGPVPTADGYTVVGYDPPVIEADGWTGIDGNGNAVCPDCWCGVCEIGHTDADERDRCEFGVDPDAPPCSADSDRIHEMRTGR